MTPSASIARHSAQHPDPLGFDALRQQALTAAQQASGALWTDYNLHDPGVSLLEALCFALTEDLYAARQPVPQLLGLDGDERAVAWARFGLYTPQALLPCHPCTADDWLIWLLHALPDARQLQMQALPHGLWRMALQGRRNPAQGQAPLRARALQAWWPMRNLGEDLDGPPRLLRTRWVELELALQLEGQRDVCELLAELLQRCDDAISACPPMDLPPDATPDPTAAGPLGRALTPGEHAWLKLDPEFLRIGDLARQLQGIPGLAAIDTLRLHLAPDEPADPLDDGPTPLGAVRRCGPDWALQLRWPDHAEALVRWRLTRDGGPLQMPTQALLLMLSDRHLLPRRLAPTAQPAAPVATPPPTTHLPADTGLPIAASAALPPLYHQALLDEARRRPGLQAQWQGYLGLLEQGLNQVQAQREHLPDLYALDGTPTRSCWSRLPGDTQLPGIDALYRRPRAQLDVAPWVDEDALARLNRVLDTQLALHGEQLDHADMQALPCYFRPQAWSVHLLGLKRQFARRLLRLSRRRGGGADLSQPLLGHPEHTPPLQERLGLWLGLAQTHSRQLSLAWLDQRLPAPDEPPVPNADVRAPEPPAATEADLPLLDPAAHRRRTDWPALRRAVAPLRDTLPAPLLRAAVQPMLFRWTPGAGGQLWLGPDDRGQHWRLALAITETQARALAQALHQAACQLQADGEGLHLVEHLLLRPLAAPTTTPDDDTQLSLVCSGWTARGADPRFRRLVAQLVAREAPAHLRCRLLWLDAGQMQAFETLWQAWLSARQAHCAALLAAVAADEATALATLDQHATALRAWLQDQPGAA